MQVSGTVMVDGRQIGTWSAVITGLRGPDNWWRTEVHMFGDKSKGWVFHHWADGYAILAALALGSHNRDAAVRGLTAIRQQSTG
jgi:hypothetical protein